MAADIDLVCVGLNHHQTPVNIREQIAFSPILLGDALKAVSSYCDVHEAAIVSTCNRVELYARGNSNSLEDFLHSHHALPQATLSPHLYRLKGIAAIGQLFRVTTSIDSLVVGEPQILGQVKNAYASALEAGTIGPLLTRVFSRAFLTAKRVRTETRIGQNAVTVSFAAVELAHKVFGDLNGLQGLLVGAGEMAELAAKHFHTKGVSLSVVNRALEHTIPTWLTTTDVVLSSTNANRHLIDLPMMRKVMRQRRHKPILLIDIAVPRNIDPQVSQLDGVYLYNVDDLGQVVTHNLAGRQIEAQLAESIINEEIGHFVDKENEHQFAPKIAKLTTDAHAIANEQLGVLLAKLGDKLDDNDREKMAATTRTIVNKILHGPIAAIKANAA